MSPLFQPKTARDVELRVHCRGGLVSVRGLRHAAEHARAWGDGVVRFGSRQELILRGVAPARVDECRRALAPMRVVVAGESAQNIVSSVPVAGLREATAWLAPGAYQDAMTRVPAGLGASVSFIDPLQDVIPRHISNLNFIASSRNDYWAAAIRAPGGAAAQLLEYSIHASALGRAAEALGFALEQSARPEDWNAALKSACGAGLAAAAEPRPPFHAARHDLSGFQVRRDKRVSLGLSAPGGAIPAALLEEICVTAQAQGIRELGLCGRPHLLVGGIDPETGADAWKLLAARHSDVFNPRAAVSHWQIARDRPDYLRLAARWSASLARALGAAAPAHCAISDGAGCPQAAVEIRETTLPGHWPRRFTISFRQDFNPEHPECHAVAARVPSFRVAGALERLIREGMFNSPVSSAAHAAQTARQTAMVLHQCGRCLTVYDETIGDPDRALPPGTAFAQLPRGWLCPVCESEKESYAPVAAAALRLSPAAARP